ncbi:MAG: M15 family metallopeptidase, partial [Flavobacteriaceae bacterium]|nr:M15 family metallopeptidase [Flavobacteriaceae bacterium]
MKFFAPIKVLSLLLILSFSSFNLPAQNKSTSLPEGFVDVKEVIPNIRTDLRYFTANNFVGKPIDGYVHPKCILSKKAAEALKKVQEEFERMGFGLLIFDAYRPQRAVDEFIAWSKDPNDIKMKEQYYPNVDKSNLFEEGYISSKSGHTRGSTVDLTIVSLKTGHILDLGGPYDFFGERSWVNYEHITKNQHAIRLMLQRRMIKYGFVPYEKEWWHFTLKDEP